MRLFHLLGDCSGEGNIHVWRTTRIIFDSIIRTFHLSREDPSSNEMTKITSSNQSHKSYRKSKSENGRTRTSEYIRGGIRCYGGVNIPCRPVAPAVRPISNVKISSQNHVSLLGKRNNPCQNQSDWSGKQKNPQSKSVFSWGNGIIHSKNQTYTDPWKN
jgi:hypothetical protein